MAATVTAANAPADTAALAATARGLMVGVPVAVGIYAWRRRPSERFGPLLIAAGFAWSLTTLAEVNGEVAYSIGRVAGWMVEVGLVYLVLAFPSGRLTGRADRVLVQLAAALVAVLYLPSVLIGQDFPAPAPYSSCHGGCPDNAFFLLGTEPGFVDSVLRPVRDVLTVLLFAAVTVRLGLRVRRATHLMRLTLTPVLGVAIARVALLTFAVGVRIAAPDSELVDALWWLIALALPAMAAAFLVGLLRWQLNVASSLQALGPRISSALTREELRYTLASTLGDPALEIAYPDAGGAGKWIDAGGRPFALPEPGAGRCATNVRSGGRTIAAIVHDEALADKQEYVEAVAAYALVALENQRLADRVGSALAEVQRSRTRIIASADGERRRIERDLHDGAQQRLVALRIHLDLLEEQFDEHPELVRQKLHTLGSDVEETLDSIRSLARGVYPPLLASEGLSEALRAAALAGPIATSVNPDGAGRYPQEVESAVYFCCLEALQNASKHAEGARSITISLSQDDELRFEVRDDGGGFDPADTPTGEGLTNMRDRLAAVGGAVTITSSPGEGTLVAGSVPATRID